MVNAHRTNIVSRGTLAKDLFGRQGVYVHHWNKALYDDKTARIIEIERLKQQPCTTASVDLVNTAHKLSRLNYLHYKSEHKRADQSLQVFYSSGSISISCIDHPDANPRVFSSVCDECSCSVRVAHESQCCHLIKLCGTFQEDCFQLCHMRHTKVIGPLNGWQPPPQNKSADLLGHSEDTSPQLNDTGLDQILEDNNAGEIVENSLIDTHQIKSILFPKAALWTCCLMYRLITVSAKTMSNWWSKQWLSSSKNWW